MELLELAFLLLVGHAVCDFVIQRQVMADGKNRRDSIHENEGFPPWFVWLASHALTHGAAVWFVTGSAVLGIVETMLHALIDFLKCEKKISFGVDQTLHLACKVAYVVVAATLLTD